MGSFFALINSAARVTVFAHDCGDSHERLLSMHRKSHLAPLLPPIAQESQLGQLRGNVVGD